MDEKDERQELTDRFRHEIRAGHDKAFFTEGELVEIYDFANDNEDEYIMLEVLYHAAGHYPYSEALTVRRAFHAYYAGTDGNIVVRMLRHVPPENILANILTIRVKEPTGAEAIEDLDRILAPVEKFEDEEIIQLVDLAADLGCYDWLTTNHQTILSKLTYVPTYLYELGEVFYENGDFDAAIKYLEELTNIDPFNPSFWNRLTDAAGMKGDFEKALQSVEFSLAIKPENNAARYLKAQALFALKRDPEEIVRLIDDASIEDAMEIGNTRPLQLLASTYSWLLKQNDKALELLLKANDRYPADRDILNALMQLQIDDIPQRLDRFRDLHPEAEGDAWIKWSRDLAQPDANYGPIMVAHVLESYFRHHLTDVGAEQMFLMLYLTRQFDNVIEYGTALREALQDPAAEKGTEVQSTQVNRMTYTSALTLIMSLMRSGNLYETVMVIQDELKWHPTLDTVSEVLELRGYRQALFEILQFMTEHPNPRQSSIDRIDPLPPLVSKEQLPGYKPKGKGKKGQ